MNQPLSNMDESGRHAAPPRDLLGQTAGMILTLLVHALFVVLMIFANTRNRQPPKPEEVPEHVIQARLVVRKGTKRPDRLLPRMESPPPAPPPRETVHLGPPKEEPPPKPDPQEIKRREEERRKREEDRRRREDEAARRKLLSTLTDFNQDGAAGGRAKQSLKEGDPDGSPDGNVTSGPRAGSVYAMMVETSLRKVWSVPQFIPRDQLIRMKASVQVEIAKDGMINNFRIVQSSGDRTFDETVEIAIKRYLRNFGTRSFGAFPPEEGLGERFRLLIWFTGASQVR